MMTLENQPSMPTADTNSRCPTTQELQRYLAGWLVENRSIEIESHLSECSACEPRVLELEAASDPLLAGLRDRVTPPGLSAESRVDLRSGEAGRVAGDNHPADSGSDSYSDSESDADAEWIAAVSDEVGQREDRSSEAARASWRPPAEGFGAYELLRPLARGGMAAVYLARHRELGKTVAIKLLPAPSAENREALAWFRREIRAAGRLSHPAPLAATPHQSPLEKLRLLARDEPPSLETLRPDAPGELTDLVAQMLAREPHDRPASAAHVAERLGPFCSSADLESALTKAQAAADAEPPAFEESVAVPKGHPGDAAGHAEARPATHAAGRDAVHEAGHAAVHDAGHAAVRNAGHANRRRWWLAVAAAPLFLFAGVMILLETQKGQLVIESEVSDVRVQVVRDGEPIRELEIRPGATVTRLRADRYEIVIDSPSDSVRVDKQTFEVRRGGTVVARVQQRHSSTDESETLPIDGATAIAPAAVAPPSAVDSDEPLYGGRPLSDWLEALRRDRSPESIGSSLVAIEAMLEPKTADRIASALTEILPKLDGELRIKKSDDRRSTVDYLAMGILAKAFSGRARFEWLTRELRSQDDAWVQRLLKKFFILRSDSSLEEAEPLLDFFENEVFAATSETPPERLEAAWWAVVGWWSVLNTESDADSVRDPVERETLATRLLSILKESPRIGREFWLQLLHYTGHSNELGKVAVSASVQALFDPESSPAEVAQAAMILGQLPTSDPELKAELLEDVERRSPVDSVDEQRWSALSAELSPVVGGRLAELAEDRARLLTHVSVPNAFGRDVTLPDVQVRKSALLDWARLFKGSSASGSDRTTPASEALSLLRLARRLPVDSAPELQQGLQAVRDATAEADVRVENIISSVLQGSVPFVENLSRQGLVKFGGLLTWPPETVSVEVSERVKSLSMPTRRGTESARRGTDFDIDSLFELQKISPDDMMGRYIHSAARLALQDVPDEADQQ